MFYRHYYTELSCHILGTLANLKGAFGHNQVRMEYIHEIEYQYQLLISGHC